MHRMYRLQLTNYKSSASTIGANLNCDDNKNVATCCDSFTTYKFQTSTQANKQSHACNNKFFVNLSFGQGEEEEKVSGILPQNYLVTHKGHPTSHHLAPRETQKSSVCGVKLAFFSLKSFQNTYKTSKSGFLHGEIIIISFTYSVSKYDVFEKNKI